MAKYEQIAARDKEENEKKTKEEAASYRQFVEAAAVIERNNKNKIVQLHKDHRIEAAEHQKSEMERQELIKERERLEKLDELDEAKATHNDFQLKMQKYKEDQYSKMLQTR